MSLTILNDVHIGAVRSGGTTPATAYQLRLDLLQQFEDMLYEIKTDLMILGDLFDGPKISMFDLLRTYRVLDDWLVRSGKDLILVEGNHDLSKSSVEFSSFQFLAKLLSEANEGAYVGRVSHIAGAGALTKHGYVIPHVANQDLFNIELAKVPAVDFLFVHCNYDNEFSVEADHSLNMSRAQAEATPVKYVVFAHEHQSRTALDGKVIIVGNQFPSSISDCLSNLEKCYLTVDLVSDTGLRLPLARVQTWKAEGDFYEVDWRDLKDEGRFIRVVGNATAAEADQVVTAISRFRQTAKALVITNAVRIEGLNDQNEITLTFEQITAFNVRDELRAMLTDDENQRIDKLELNHA